MAEAEPQVEPQVKNHQQHQVLVHKPLRVTKADLRPLYDGSLHPRCTHDQLREDDPSVDHKLCIVCDKEADMQCVRGCGARYCNKKCQQDDWEFHKQICTELVNKGLAEKKKLWRGKPLPADCFWGYIFIPRQENPLIVVLQGNQEDAETKTMLEYAPPARQRKPIHIQADPLHINAALPWRRIGHQLRFVCFGRFQAYYQEQPWPINKAIMNLGHTGHTFPWYGPVLVVAYRYQNFTGKPEDSDKHDWLDVTARDFRSVVEYINTCKANPCLTEPILFPKAAHGHAVWPAVKINCLGDKERFNYDIDMEPVCVPSEPFYKVRPRLPVLRAQCLGFDWVYERCVTNLDFGDSKLANENHIGRFFVPAKDPKTGQPSLNRITAEPGTIIVMHKSGQTISWVWIHAVFTF
ncbi:hypothetical protein F4778DRAFT_365757 [Xylariomycetidae sp. FL2044]|nr:hypothetical protein F4778DRAFT_365757 [Xylariomycetidae sp. FL2044]